MQTKQKTPSNNTLGFITGTLPINALTFSGLILECEFSQDKYQDSLFTTLAIHLPDEIAKAHKKRKAEFLAGRYCAQLALQQFGHIETHVPIGPNRSPQWPTDTPGSITHTHNLAICALNNKPKAIGIDYEPIISTETAREIKGLIINQAEETSLIQTDLPFELWLTIAFSIKESLFKALYPTVKQHFDFLDAEIQNIDCKNQIMTLTLNRDLCPEARKGQQFFGTYNSHREGFITLLEC
ncbi:4'-phosphopantetheinyl transferase family protein [Microbulbifer variabilis]|uniref:4'-phosphopantetheinyl transferase family protein n=1 Tax=Microbulbifer variabilis TaxID=266805 RepID=UPI001CFCB61B|nr:4'-phosphopantetheinyl transferase superfamily protein [Microbulbifer variabilis]